ncbi:MAG TPA: GDSL family lipase [Selenomonas sp.]|nr:GDSL family lipase [Selenomonas sp.]
MKQKYAKKIFYGVLLLAIGVAVTGTLACAYHRGQPGGQAAMAEPAPGTVTRPLAFSPLLHWPKNPQAVVYEMEIFRYAPAQLPTDAVSPQAVYRTRAIYQNYFNPPLQDIAPDMLGRAPLYWRVRALGFDGQPVSAFSKLQILYTSKAEPDMEAPVPLAHYGGKRGETLLYPVYSWAGQHDAADYEVCIYRDNPEEKPQAQPVERLTTENLEIYDEQPRIGTYYWRVRALDSAQQPLGFWSAVETIRTVPEDHWQVAVLGDSISHGGGHYSYNPADFEFSWLHYLDFDTLNLSCSGDTSASTLARFDRDVLPFQPRYLLVFTGTNSLRGGAEPEEVINDLQAIREKALAHGIKPILMTLPPINPAAIHHVFDEPTVDDWQERFRVVNRYIRTQVHIDIAHLFPTKNGVLAPEMALDGLHEDIAGKRMIGEAVNRAWPRVRREADAETP